MKCWSVRISKFCQSAVALVLLSTTAVFAQTPSEASPHRQFRPGTIQKVEDVPDSPLRRQLDRLPTAARTRAAAWLKDIHFTSEDLEAIEADPEGGLYFVDHFTFEATDRSSTKPETAAAAVPANPFPASLVFHSKPGAPNVIYLNFTGETVTNSAWNTSENRPVFHAVAFSTDADSATFNDAERAAIEKIWSRVAEDYAPFNVDVTTERPATFDTRTAMALITRNTDVNGNENPSASAGGVAYINVFGDRNFAQYRPAWVYYNNLGNSESHIAEAASHEIGHNLGLTHDGQSNGKSYYGGHGSGEISWGPIMGTGYNRNVSQWSRGEYYLANNTQDDLAIIAAKLTYNADDHGATASTATALLITGGTNIVSTTPDNDPTNLNPANKGVLESESDVDVFSFSTGSGTVRLKVNPRTMPSGIRGGNLDVAIELRDAADNVIASANPASETGAQIQTHLTRGTYYLVVRNSGAGSPLTSPATGYTAYGSIGQYFISGFIVPPQASEAMVQLVTSSSNPDHGTVSPGKGSYASGTTVEIVATPKAYFTFVGWTNEAFGYTNPLSVRLDDSVSVEALFAEQLTATNPTPLWWLAANGVTSDFESAVVRVGANGLPLWQSYIAGLNPNDPQDRLELLLSSNAAGDVLSWKTVANRVYSVFMGSDLRDAFNPVAGGLDLPATTKSIVIPKAPGESARFYRLEVKKL